MAQQFSSGFCHQCEATRKVERKGTNHILHLILTLLTVGFWALVWIGVAVKFGGWRCSSCGSTSVKNVG